MMGPLAILATWSVIGFRHCTNPYNASSASLRKDTD